MWLSSVLVSGTGKLQDGAGAERANLRQAVAVGDAPPFVGVAVLLIGDPGERVALLDGPQAQAIERAGGGILSGKGGADAVVLDLLEGDVQRGPHGRAVGQEERELLLDLGDDGDRKSVVYGKSVDQGD